MLAGERLERAGQGSMERREECGNGGAADTNAWIHYLKNPGSRIRASLERHTPNESVRW